MRRHWAVETSHQILDTAFAEDDPWTTLGSTRRGESLARGDHPWIEQNPRATFVVIVLRRIAYTLLSLWRGVTLRSAEQRTRPWRDVMRDILLAAVTATAEHLRALRRHRLAPVAT